MTRPNSISDALPRASNATRRLNPHLFPAATTSLPNFLVRVVPHAEPKPHKAPALGTTVQGKAEGVSRTVVRFTGYRVRPLDPDNFAGSIKDLLDGLCRASLLHGDEPWRIRLETEQVKVAHYKDERTLIEINPPLC